MISHHSPSSFSTAAQCERKWWYDHVERRRDPDVTWVQIEVAGSDWQKIATSRQRSTARGHAVHECLEDYYLYRTGPEERWPWSSYIGQIALSGRAHLPAREACLEIRVERSLGSDPYPSKAAPDRTALVLDGVRLLGYVDLRVRMDPAHTEAKRLGISSALVAGGGWYTFDYKTSKNVERYALTSTEAPTDPQGVLYTADAMIAFDTEAHGMRWVYMQTEGKTFSKPVDALVTYEGSRVHLAALVDRARDLGTRDSIEMCPPNPDACQNYGGCPYHITRGGPCEAQRKIGRIAIMGFKEHYLGQKAAKAAAAGAAAGAVESPAANTPSTPPPETPAQIATTVAPPARKRFGQKDAPSATEPPVGANGPAPAEPSAGANGPAPADPPVDHAPKKARAPKASLADQVTALLDAIKAEFACDEMGALRLAETMLDVKADALNAARNAA